MDIVADLTSRGIVEVKDVVEPSRFLVDQKKDIDLILAQRALRSRIC